jgi:hypothetical protein
LQAKPAAAFSHWPESLLLLLREIGVLPGSPAIPG